MTVLGDGAGQKYRERHDACREKGHENHMRSRFRNDAYDSSKEDHQNSIVTDPALYVDMLQAYPQNQQDSERPCEYHRKMLPDYMIPEMLLDEMIGSKQQNEQHDHAQSRKQHIHPVFAQEIDMEALMLGFSHFMHMRMVCNFRM